MSIDWSDLYRTTFPDLVRFLHRKVWDPDQARDLAQEAFVRALRDPPDRPRAWLFRVAANLARDEARTVLRRRRHLALLKGESEDRGARVPAPDELLEAAEQGERLRTALASLSDRDRDVLLLKEAGMSYTEIAEQTGLALGAIGTTLSRARRRLAEAYREEGTDAARG